MMSSKFFLTPALVALSCTFLSTFSSAGIVEIKNENDKELTLYIQAVGAPSEDLAWKEMTIPARTTISVNVLPEDLGGKKTYFIRGKTNPLTPKGSCVDLQVDKDYKIVFKKNLALGTEWVCESAQPSKSAV